MDITQTLNDIIKATEPHRQQQYINIRKKIQKKSPLTDEEYLTINDITSGISDVYTDKIKTYEDKLTNGDSKDKYVAKNMILWLQIERGRWLTWHY